MSSINQLAPTNGSESVIVLPGGSQSGTIVTIAVLGPTPVTGNVTVSYAPPGSNVYTSLRKATLAALPASGALTLRIDDPAGKIKVVFAGVGAGNTFASVWALSVDHPAGLYLGLAAITTQPYTEAN